MAIDSVQKFLVLGSWFLVGLAGCGELASGDAADDLDAPSPYASEIVAHSLGDGSGWGQEHLPDVVLGPPEGATSGSPAAKRDEVLSLGAGGEVVLGFDRPITDGPGADFVVFENPFWVRGDPTDVWAELGEVSVSQDGQTWHTFVCAAEPTEPGQWPGCAGWTPTKSYAADEAIPLDPETTGGDGFDLADVGIESARFVRVRDMLESTNSTVDNVGFDLDAVGVVHFE
jgi:hypothetical protein